MTDALAQECVRLKAENKILRAECGQQNATAVISDWNALKARAEKAEALVRELREVLEEIEGAIPTVDHTGKPLIRGLAALHLIETTLAQSAEGDDYDKHNPCASYPAEPRELPPAPSTWKRRTK